MKPHGCATTPARSPQRRAGAGRSSIDQGTADEFLDVQLRPELFEAACADAGIPLRLRRQDGYDHSYYFISTFMADHLRHHAEQLVGA